MGSGVEWRDTNKFLKRLQLPICLDQQLLLVFPLPQRQQRPRIVALLDHFLCDLMFAVQHRLDLLLVLSELVALDLHVEDRPEALLAVHMTGGGGGGGRAQKVYLSWAVTRWWLEVFPMVRQSSWE